jgi:hypothetical protein
MRIKRKVAIAINPRPPTNIRTKITPCPNGLQYVPVLTRVWPVTVTADVAVKNEVTGEV